MIVLRKRILGSLPARNEQEAAARGNRFAAATMKKRWTRYIALNFAHAPRVNVPVRMVCNWFCPNKRRDPDNIAAAKKFILDGLQVAGVLKNDGWGQIVGFSDNFFVDKKDPGVEIVLICPERRQNEKNKPQ